MIYIVFAFNEHEAIGGTGDCQGIFSGFSDALLKAFEIIDRFEDVSIETIKDKRFELIIYKDGKDFINEKTRITLRGWDASIKVGEQTWNIELNRPNEKLDNLIIKKII